MTMTFFDSLYEGRLPPPTDLEAYRCALEWIERYGIAPQTYVLLAERLERTPPFFRSRLESLHRESLHRNLYIRLETERLLDAFEAEGIDVIPLKGTRFAAKVFGGVGGRPTSDIDVLIRRPDLARAEACVRALGFVMEGERIEGHFHRSFAKPIPGAPTPLPVELHWSLLPEGTSRFDASELWREAVPSGAGKHVFELSDHHAFYLICLHGWKHAFNSPKYYLDIAQTIHAAGPKLDYELLFRDARRHRTLRRLRSSLSVAYEQLPHLQLLLPFPYRRMHRRRRDRDAFFWESPPRSAGARTDAGGEWPAWRKLRQYARLARYQWLDYDSPLHAFAATVQWLRAWRRG
jgi:hypothetical protein